MQTIGHSRRESRSAGRFSSTLVPGDDRILKSGRGYFSALTRDVNFLVCSGINGGAEFINAC